MLLAARDVPLPSRYSLEPGDWDTGLGCVVRAASTALGRDDLEVTRVHTASVAVPLHDSEELISNIVRLAPSRPDGGLPDVSARKAAVVVVVVLVVMVMVVVVVVCLSHDNELISNIVRLAPSRPDGGLPDVSARKAVVVVVVVLVVMVMVVMVVMCLSHNSELTSNIVRLSPGLPDVSARNCCCCCCCCGGGGGGGGGGVFVARQRGAHQ